MHMLQPFIFDMQRCMTEMALKNMENIVIHIVIDSVDDVDKIKYKHVEENHEID